MAALICMSTFDWVAPWENAHRRHKASASAHPRRKSKTSRSGPRYSPHGVSGLPSTPRPTRLRIGTSPCPRLTNITTRSASACSYRLCSRRKPPPHTPRDALSVISSQQRCANSHPTSCDSTDTRYILGVGPIPKHARGQEGTQYEGDTKPNRLVLPPCLAARALVCRNDGMTTAAGYSAQRPLPCLCRSTVYRIPPRNFR
jgi:hypothetical protein